MKKRILSTLALLSVLISVLLISGCGPSEEEIATQTAAAWTPTPTKTPTPVPPTATPTLVPSPTPPSPEAMLEAANAAMAKVETYHFEMVIEMSVGMEGLTVDVPISFSGDYQAPDRMQALMSIEFLGISIETELITIGGISYATDPMTGDWEKQTEDTESVTPFQPDSFIGADSFELENPELVGLEELDGVAVYHISGSVPPEGFEEIFGDSGGETTFVIDYWIGMEDNLVRKIMLNVTFSANFLGTPGELQEVSLAAEINFTDFGKEVYIEAPEIE